MTKSLISQHIFPKSNPWENVKYNVAETFNSENRWILPEDKEVLSENKNYDNLNLSPNPVPWAGRWNNDELPRLVILGLNPSSGYDNANQKGSTSKRGDESDSTYNDLVNKNLRGEAGLGELIFSKAMHDRNSYPRDTVDKSKRKSYWLEHLYPLYKAVFADQATGKKDLYKFFIENDARNIIEKDIRKAKEFFDSILTVELFPYHTKKGNEIGKLFEKDKTNEAEKEEERKNGKALIYPSSKFNVDLVKYMIKNNVPVIVARAWDKWYDALGENYISKCYRLNNPQNITISENNLTPKFIPPCWACQDAMAWDKVIGNFNAPTPNKSFLSPKKLSKDKSPQRNMTFKKL